MTKQQKTYTREFKLEAVQLVRRSGKPMSHIARDLGVSDSALYHWCKQLADQGEQAFPGSGHQTAEQEEIRPPAQLGLDLRGRGDQHGRIASAPRRGLAPRWRPR